MVFAKDTNYQISGLWGLQPHFARGPAIRKRPCVKAVGVGNGLPLSKFLPFSLSACLPVLFTCCVLLPVHLLHLLTCLPVHLLTCCALFSVFKDTKKAFHRLSKGRLPPYALFPVQILRNANNHRNSSSARPPALRKKFPKKSFTYMMN
jgi:hypothetical protein